MYRMLPVPVWYPRLSIVYYSGIHANNSPLNTIFQPLTRAKRTGIEAGDMESAITCGTILGLVQLEIKHLSETNAYYIILLEYAGSSGLKNAVDVTKPLTQSVLNLMGEGCDPPTSLIGQDLNSELFGKLFVYTHFYGMFLGYMFGDFQQASVNFTKLQHAIGQVVAVHDAMLLVFFDALVAVKLYRTSKKSKILSRALYSLRRIRYWAQYAPENFLCRQFLLEAEISIATTSTSATCTATSTHNSTSTKLVHGKYVACIALAKDSGNLLVTALGNELFGKYHWQDRNDVLTARPFLLEALRWYTAWGANAKVEHLRSELASVVID